VAPETTETGAATLAERLRVKMAATPVIVGDTSIWIASSFGVAERTCDMGEMDNLIERADQALRIAKHSGRNLVVGFACNKLAESFSRGSPSRELSRVTARELATPITCIRSDETIQFAVKFLLHHKIASAPVVDASGTLVGCISDRDLLMVDLTRGNSSRQVCELMKTNVVSYEESVPGDQVYQFLCRVSIQQVVVVKDARPTGVINTNSLLNFVQHRVGT
jgi:predicted transcriptional regulator